MSKHLVLEAISSCKPLSQAERIDVYNVATRALRDLVADVATDPALAPQIVPVNDVEANDYNPNHVAAPEMALLEDSIRVDGVTMPIVTVHDANRNRWVTVDGFHRQIVLRDRLKRSHVVVSVIDTDVANRVASTIRHNRARGKHQVDLMATIVKILIREGWADHQIATHVGMSADELLRLKQTVGIAEVMAGTEYSKSWGTIDESDLLPSESGRTDVFVARANAVRDPF